MRGSACTAVSAVIYTPARLPWRHLAGRQGVISRRKSHSSQRLLHGDHPPEVPKGSLDSAGTSSGKRSDDSPAEESPVSSSDSPDKPGKPIDRSNYGSALRRAGRNLKRSTDAPPFQLPQKFLRNNVILQNVLQTAILNGQRTIVPVDISVEPKRDEVAEDSVKRTVTDQSPSQKKLQNEDGDQPVWKIDIRIMREVESAVLAGLQTPASELANAPISAKPHIVLRCPKKGGVTFLDALIKQLAATTGADLVQLNAQDLAEIGGDYLDDLANPKIEPLSSLSYDVHAIHQGTQDSTDKLVTDETGDDGPLAASAKIVQNIAEFFKGKYAPDPQQQQARQIYKGMGPVALDSNRDQKLASFLDSLLHACDAKRALGPTDNEGVNDIDSVDASYKDEVSEQISTMPQNAPKSPPLSSPPLILQINDYPGIFQTHSGGKILDALHAALYERRTAGQRILLIGTSAPESDALTPSRLDHDTLLEEFDIGPTRIIVVPPIVDRESDKLFLRYHRQRVQSINIRHLQDMIRRLASNRQQITEILSKREFRINVALGNYSRIRRHVWSSDHVHRVATVALGITQADDKAMTIEHVEKALEIIESSDNAKHGWLFGEKERARSLGGANRNRKENGQTLSPKKDRKQLEKECNSHEKKLLSGMVDPSDIRTTFAHVHAPKETVRTLKDLTLLPLACPEEFNYGVLAEQTVSGLLLYGPPGTGKTLLAKAVAKEGGVTILEVSGADLYNKWVGEGEKNVKAMFSLARKLKPCIVFIDEADAILGARGNDRSRPSHRDLINQFLREWDGMREATALIMVATNRPFDLDDAVVRRLPRRILIDLPTEKDREEILKILLQKEILDPEVSLAKLAADTPLYSGSDLKHLVVTAAQACVRENYESTKVISQSSPTSVRPAPLASPPPSPVPARPLSPPVPPLSPSQSLPPLPSIQSSTSSMPRAFVYSGWHNSLPTRLKALIPPNPFTMSKSLPPGSRPLTSPPPSPTDTPSTTASTSPLATPPPSTTDTSISTATSSTTPPTAPPSPSHSPPPSTPTDINPRRILRPHHFARALEEISA
ncbi:MAG: hypothetical protein Q9225_006078, partial [Loekoesia sp. 1 TL-2023]